MNYHAKLFLLWPNLAGFDPLLFVHRASNCNTGELHTKTNVKNNIITYLFQKMDRRTRMHYRNWCTDPWRPHELEDDRRRYTRIDLSEGGFRYVSNKKKITQCLNN